MQPRENYLRLATNFSHLKNVTDFRPNRAKQTIFYCFLCDNRARRVIALFLRFASELTKCH